MNYGQDGDAFATPLKQLGPGGASALPPPVMTSRTDAPSATAGAVLSYDDILKQTHTDRAAGQAGVPPPAPPASDQGPSMLPPEPSSRPVRTFAPDPGQGASWTQPTQEDYAQYVQQQQPGPSYAQQMQMERQPRRQVPSWPQQETYGPPRPPYWLWQYKHALLVAGVVFTMLYWVAPRAATSVPQLFHDGRLNTLGIVLVALLSGAIYRGSEGLLP